MSSNIEKYRKIAKKFTNASSPVNDGSIQGFSEFVDVCVENADGPGLSMLVGVDLSTEVSYEIVVEEPEGIFRNDVKLDNLQFG